MSARRLRLNVTKPAARDLQDIRRFTRARWGAEQADTYLAAIRDAMQLLCDHPTLGKDRTDIFFGLRSHRVSSHAIFYLVQGDDLIVQRVLHERMDAGASQMS